MPRTGIAHVDGGSRGNPGPASWAFVLVDEADGATVERAEAMGTATNNVAEYTALVKLLTTAKELVFTTLSVRSDSELMVRQMTGAYKVKNADLLPLYSEAKKLSEDFDSFQIEHIRRELNGRADELCNLALDAAGSKKAGLAPAPKSKGKAAPADKDLRERCLPLIEFYAEDWRNGSPVKPFAEMLLKELLAVLDGKPIDD